jgi:hypothetical protein
MSNLTLHLQYEPPELAEFVDRCQGKLRYIKGVNCYPNLGGVRTIGRVFIDDNLSNRLVTQGAAGVEQWIYLCRGEYEKAPHVWSWQGPNEYIIDSFDKAARWNEFHIEWIERMSALGKRCMAGNINTGWPRLQKFGDAPPYPPALRPTIEALVQHDGILSLHEYGPGDMRQGVGAHCLRYRNTVGALEKAGVPIPRIFIGETGIDVPDPNFPLDHHHRGWTEWTDRAGYLEQLRWYAGELAQDDYVIGAAIFTVCNWDWITFNVDRELAMGIADIVAREPEVVPPPPPPKPSIIDMVDKLKVRTPTKAVIHHSGGRHRPAKVRQHIQAIARFHVRRRGWPTIAYHYIIDADGNIYRTNRPQVASFHSGDKATNLSSYGICMLGNFRTYDPTPAQLDACRWLVGELNVVQIVPHKAVVQTSCPGRWERWGAQITG